MFRIMSIRIKRNGPCSKGVAKDNSIKILFSVCIVFRAFKQRPLRVEIKQFANLCRNTL